MAMAKLASDLKASELKQRSLGKAYETLYSQASSMLALSLQWKDLEEHFDSTRNAIRTGFEELQEREKQLETKELKFESEMESKKDELFGVQKLIDEKVQEVIEIKRLIQKHSEEIEREEKRVMEVQKLVVDKERECSLINRRIHECTKKLNWVEKRIVEKVNEVECKEQELTKYHEDIKLKVEQVGLIDGAIVERQEKIESKEEEVRAAQMLLEELERRIRSKEEKLSWIEKSIEDSSKLANYKEEEMRVIQGSLNVYRDSIKSKESALDAILESIEGKKKEYDEKEEQIKTLQRLIEDCEKELILKDEKLKEEALKVKEYSLLNKATDEWFCKLEYKKREVELKEKHLDSKKEEFKIWVEESGKELNSLERKLKEQARELELAKKQCGVVISQVKIGTLENSPDNNANISASASDQSNINITDGKSLQLFMAEHTKRNDSVSSISSFLQQESSEPGKLVLNAMQGFYPSNLSAKKKESDVVLIRRTCILLLDELKKVSPQINPELRNEAKKCASGWKAKMKVGSENSLEILGFLKLVTTYELSSSYDGKELQHLLDVVAQHEQAMGLFGAFGTTDKTPGNSNISFPIKSENRVVNTEATSSSQSIQQHTATTIDARHMQGIQNEQFREAAYSALKGIINDLIGKKRLTEAVGLIYTLKLFDKFRPAQILKEYVDNGRKCCVVLIMKKELLDEKDMITDEHIADLRVVIQCIKDYSLESEYPPEEVERQIAASERYKKLIRQNTSLKNVELQEQIERKQDQPTSGAKLQEMAEHKTSKALKRVEHNASSKVEKQQQLQAQKAAFTVEQQGQQQEQTNAKLQGKEGQSKELELKKKQAGSQMKVNSEPLESTPAANNANSTVASVKIEKAVSPARTTFSSPNHPPTAKNNIIFAPGTNRKRNGQRAAFFPPNVAAIQRLIQQKKLGKAYKSIRKFNLFKKFPPEKVLKEHIEKAMKCMENSKTKKMFHEQDQVMREGITDLRRAIDCIKLNNLKSQYTPESIEEQILVLQKFMEDQRNENQNKRLCSTVDSNFQQHEHKFQRTSLSTDRTYGMHPDYPHPGPFYNEQFSIPSNYPVQFSLPANHSLGLGYGNPGIVPNPLWDF